MKFKIDRTIKNSYKEEIIYEEFNDFSWMREDEYDEEKIEKYKSRYIETNDEVISGYIDKDICYRTIKKTVKVIEVNTLEELYAITKENGGQIVFNTHKYASIDGWIEIYDDYRE
jgi:hypothetical protein